MREGGWWTSWEVTLALGRSGAWDRHGSSGVGVWIYTLHRFFRSTWPSHDQLASSWAFSLSMSWVIVNTRLENTGKLERGWENAIWASSPSYALGPVIQTAAGWTVKRDQRKISFYLPDKSYVWIDFSFVSFFLSFWLKDEYSEEKQEAHENWESLHHKTGNTVRTMQGKNLKNTDYSKLKIILEHF